MSEIIFEVQEDEVDGGYVAMALGHGIVTQGNTLDELKGKREEGKRGQAPGSLRASPLFPTLFPTGD